MSSYFPDFYVGVGVGDDGQEGIAMQCGECGSGIVYPSEPVALDTLILDGENHVCHRKPVPA